jgi:hypothetical protein
LIFFVSEFKKLGGQSINEFNTNKYCQGKNKGCGFCPNVTFEDNEFKDNNPLNDQGKDEGTIIVTAQLNINMSRSLN